MILTNREERYYAWLAACDAWQAELVKEYGNRAGDYRYRPDKNAATPELARLREDFMRLGEWYNLP